MIFQAHKGVSTDAPENTMAAFRAAVIQGYAYIETDPGVTADGIFVLLHDETINRTARQNDGTPLPAVRRIVDMPYKDALQYDFGIAFSEAFRGERIPLLTDVLQLVKETGITLKIDNKFTKFSPDVRERFCATLQASGARVALTCADEHTAAAMAARLPDAEIHYDGGFDEATLQRLQALVGDRLVFWMPYECRKTSWVKVPFANADNTAVAKKYARLGIWILSEQSQVADAERWGADIIETNGEVKPRRKTDGGHDDRGTHSLLSGARAGH